MIEFLKTAIALILVFIIAVVYPIAALISLGLLVVYFGLAHGVGEVIQSINDAVWRKDLAKLSGRLENDL